MRTPDQIIVTSRAPDAVMTLDSRTLRVTDTVTLDPSHIDRPAGFPAAARLSGDIQSAAFVGGRLWAVTGERDGDPALLRFKLPERHWTVATWAAQPRGFDQDARGLLLRPVRNELWAVTAQTTPSYLYRIAAPTRVDEFSGHDLQMVSCAHDIAESAGGNLLFLSCSNELQEVRAEEQRLILVKARPTLASQSGPGNWTDEIIVRDGNAVFVALNTNQPPSRPAHARIAQVDDRGVTTLFDLADAVVISMAVTRRLVVAVLKQADGSVSVVMIERNLKK